MTLPGPELLKRAETGDPDAQIELGRHYEQRSEIRLARSWLTRAARSGRADAVRMLAASLLSRPPVQQADGIGLLQMAADNGDAEAAYMLAVAAAQTGALADRWRHVEAYLAEAAARGLPRAQAERALLGGAAGDLDVAAFASALPLEPLRTAPRMFVIRECLRSEHCDWLIAESRPRLGRATVYDPHSGDSRVQGARSNSHLVCDIAHSSVVLALLRVRIAACIAPVPARLEEATILHYAEGEEFTPHFDFFDAREPAYARQIAEQGQRIATCLVYLNDDYDGGGTRFPEIDLEHKGRKGDALLFWNVDQAGTPDQQALHAGSAPTRGEKWVVSQWLRGPPAR